MDLSSVRTSQDLTSNCYHFWYPNLFFLSASAHFFPTVFNFIIKHLCGEQRMNPFDLWNRHFVAQGIWFCAAPPPRYKIKYLGPASAGCLRVRSSSPPNCHPIPITTLLASPSPRSSFPLCRCAFNSGQQLDIPTQGKYSEWWLLTFSFQVTFKGRSIYFIHILLRGQHLIGKTMVVGFIPSPFFQTGHFLEHFFSWCCSFFICSIWFKIYLLHSLFPRFCLTFFFLNFCLILPDFFLLPKAFFAISAIFCSFLKFYVLLLHSFPVSSLIPHEFEMEGAMSSCHYSNVLTRGYNFFGYFVAKTVKLCQSLQMFTTFGSFWLFFGVFSLDLRWEMILNLEEKTCIRDQIVPETKLLIDIFFLPFFHFFIFGIDFFSKWEKIDFASFFWKKCEWKFKASTTVPF